MNLFAPLIFGLFFLIDVVIDIGQGTPIYHIWLEVSLFIFAFVLVSWNLKILFQKDERIKNLLVELNDTKKSYQEWKSKAHDKAAEFRELMDQQFASWGLSPSEKDVVLLLIKGLSMKEIAELRSSHEKTVRGHASQVYKKSQLSGRQELAAFFLEDLLSFQS